MVWSADQDDAAGTALSVVGGMCPMKLIDFYRLNNFLITSKT